MPVIPGTWEAELGRLNFEASLLVKKKLRTYLKEQARRDNVHM
jgi:hypothetical protein